MQGARANDLPGHVPDEVKQDRWDRFMQKAQAISAAKLAAKVGTRQAVIVDSIDADGATCRTMADAPEIDGNLFIDEGFGTLDADTLQAVMAEIDHLRAGGRTVGIVSHVAELRDQIAERIAVRRVASGRSTLRVTA